MPWQNFLAVGCGAVLGAWARWGLGMLLNSPAQAFPIGTLAANLLGGLGVGVFIAAADPVGLSSTTRLFVATGFLGALTTFSAFSAETVALLQRAQYGWAMVAVGAHLGGSLIMTFAGVALAKTMLGR